MADLLQVAKNWHHHLAFASVIDKVSPFALDENEMDHLLVPKTPPRHPFPRGHNQRLVPENDENEMERDEVRVVWHPQAPSAVPAKRAPVGGATRWREGANDLWRASNTFSSVHVLTPVLCSDGGAFNYHITYTN